MSDAMSELDIAAFREQVRRTRAALEQTHERVLAMVGSPQLMQYEDLRELVRAIDSQISALQGSLLTLGDVLSALTSPDPGLAGPEA
jgi:small-conductance mechanosensitive channel